MIIAIGGPPGSGKSTAAALYAETHGCTLVSAGQVFREGARARGLSLEAYGAYAATHPEVDRELDALVLRRAAELAMSGDVVTDGRLQAALFAREKVPALRVLVDAPLEVRAERVAKREGIPPGEARRQILIRESSERARYRELYGLEANDRAHYDLVLDSSTLSPEEIVAAIRARVVG